jgi:hypothetical protein
VSRLALVWDGTWLTWTAFNGSSDVGRREISRADMVPEVLRALRNQVGSGAHVLHAEWGVAVTAMPAAMLSEASRRSAIQPWFDLHHGPLPGGQELRADVLTDVADEPCLAVAGSTAWNDAVSSLFPQARHVSVVQALLHDAIQWNRREPSAHWTFRVDARDEGAVLVAACGETLQWVHHLPKGCTSEDLLYAMVNAVHRSEGDINASRVMWSGSAVFAAGWDRFFAVHPAEGADVEDKLLSWRPLFESMSACG